MVKQCESWQWHPPSPKNYILENFDNKKMEQKPSIAEPPQKLQKGGFLSKSKGGLQFFSSMSLVVFFLNKIPPAKNLQSVESEGRETGRSPLYVLLLILWAFTIDENSE